MRVQPLDQEDSLEEGMVTHCSILDLRMPRTGEPGSSVCCKESDTTEAT